MFTRKHRYKSATYGCLESGLFISGLDLTGVGAYWKMSRSLLVCSLDRGSFVSGVLHLSILVLGVFLGGHCTSVLWPSFS